MDLLQGKQARLLAFQMCAKDKFVMDGPLMGKLLNKDLYRSVYNNHVKDTTGPIFPNRQIPTTRPVLPNWP